MPKTTLNPGQVNEDTLQDANNNTKIQVEENPDENKIRFDTAGTERMIIDSNGKVGIGTASLNPPAAPSKELDVVNRHDGVTDPKTFQGKKEVQLPKAKKAFDATIAKYPNVRVVTEIQLPITPADFRL